MSALLPTRISGATYVAYIERKAKQKTAHRAQRPPMVLGAVYLAMVERCLRLEQRLAEVEHDRR